MSDPNEHTITDDQIAAANFVFAHVLRRLLTAGPPAAAALASDPTPAEPLAFVEHRLVDDNYVSDLIGSDRKTLRGMVSRGEFPAPIPVSMHRKRWRLGTVFAWIRERDEAAQAKQRRPTA